MSLDPRIETVTEAELENRRLRSKVKDLERQADRARAGESAWLAALERCFVEPQTVAIPPRPKLDRRKRSQRTMVLHLSDTQIGKITSSYNTEVARERIVERLFSRMESLLEAERSIHKINDLRVYLGGDMVEGEMVFPTQPHFIDSPVIEQTIETAHIIVDLLAKLSGLVRNIRVVAVRGNHGRSGKYDRTNPATNWDSMTYECISMILKGTKLGERVELIHDREKFYQIDYIYNWGFLLVHGDQIRGQLGLPWYGVRKKASGWQDSLTMMVDGYRVSESWDYLLFGHFHTYAGPVTDNFRIWMCNGTTESDNEYAQEGLAACGEPVQRVGFVSPERGWEKDCPVYLSEKQRLPQRKMAALQARAIAGK